MEDILASIRRIISEEDAPPPAGAREPELRAPAPPPPAATQPAPRQDDPVLELYERADADALEDLLVFDAEEAPAEPSPFEAEPEPVRVHAQPSTPASVTEGLTSEHIAAAAAGAFTRLAGSLRIADQQGQTLEGVVREILRPMLREWLEQHLPAIVEAKVEAELERISRLSR